MAYPNRPKHSDATLMPAIYQILTFVGFGLCIAWFVHAPGFSSAVGCLAVIAAFFRNEIHGVVGLRVLSLTPKSSLIRSLTRTRYSFVRKEFIHPFILEDLVGWLSDTNDQVIAVDIMGANRSNRYWGPVSSNVINPTDPYPLVKAQRDGSKAYFAYQYVSCSFSGIHIVRTWRSGGGSGIFSSLLLVTLSDESAMTIDVDGSRKADRFVIKKMATITLGDRYNGRISYRYGILTVGECDSSIRPCVRKQRQRLLIL